jgi:hypothetical protein
MLAPGRSSARDTASASARPRTCPALINLSLAAGRPGPNELQYREKKGEGNSYYWSGNITNPSTSLLLVQGVIWCWNSGMHPGARARSAGALWSSLRA